MPPICVQQTGDVLEDVLHTNSEKQANELYRTDTRYYVMSVVYMGVQATGLAYSCMEGTSQFGRERFTQKSEVKCACMNAKANYWCAAVKY